MAVNGRKERMMDVDATEGVLKDSIFFCGSEYCRRQPSWRKKSIFTQQTLPPGYKKYIIDLEFIELNPFSRKTQCDGRIDRPAKYIITLTFLNF